MSAFSSDVPSDQQRLHEVLKDFSSAMFVTMTPAGDHHARPMAVAELRDTAVCFITAMSSPKIDEISANPDVCVVFQGSASYASLTGTARVSRDRARIDRLWSPAWKTWFPNGKDDPEIALIDVDPTSGEFWDNSWGNGVKYAFEAARALFQGDRPNISRDQHAKVDL